MKILFMQTGGTIDKDYPRKTRGYAFEIGKPAVARILERANPHFDFEIVSVLKKDSLDITDEDREEIKKACEQAGVDRIVITHGTDTMIETAEKLKDIVDKTIVLTGAMRPQRFSNSDAAFNVGVAVGAVNVLEGGVYVAMNGMVYPWDQCARDMETGKFVKKPD